MMNNRRLMMLVVLITLLLLYTIIASVMLYLYVNYNTSDTHSTLLVYCTYLAAAFVASSFIVTLSIGPAIAVYVYVRRRKAATMSNDNEPIERRTPVPDIVQTMVVTE